MTRNFRAELDAAAAAQDWEAHARIWDERRIAAVEYDEMTLSAELERQA